MASAEIADAVPKSRQLGFTLWCIVAAFGTYFCMYGFRKPFTAVTYPTDSLWGLSYLTLLVMSQTIGYTISKFIGIRVIASMPPHRRAITTLLLIGLAQLALLLFAIIPAPWNFLCLFLNGLPLGMVFGLVLGYLEGRQVTEALTAGLCASFILADGVTKTVGASLFAAGVPAFWVPVAAGAVFTMPLFVFVWMLTQIPPPTARDIAHRAERQPMNSQERWSFFTRYATGLILLVLCYLLITILRSVRSDFANPIWTGLGYVNTPSVFTSSEVLVMLGVLVINGSVIWIRNNRWAFFVAIFTCCFGFILLLLTLVSWQAGWIDGFQFMVMGGLGVLIPYVAVHTTAFERLIALTRDRGNIGYLMYLADAFGYLGVVGVLVARRGFSWHAEENFLAFFLVLSWITGIASLVLLAACGIYFARRTRTAIPSPVPTI